MKKFNFTDKLKLVKATILSGTILLSNGCGIVEKTKEPKAKVNNDTKIVDEIETTSNEINTQSDYSARINPKTNEIEMVQTTQPEQSTTKQPESTTKQPETTTKQAEQSTTKQPETTTKQPESTTKQPETTTEQKEVEVPTNYELPKGTEIPYKETTTTTTTTTQTTTQKPNIQQTYTLNDIKTNPDAFNYYAAQLQKDLFNGNKTTSLRPYGKAYITSGYYESKVILAILNNEYISENVLTDNSVFEGLNEEDIRKFSSCVDFALCEEMFGGKVDFNNYMFDKKMANLINTVDKQWHEARKGNYAGFDKTLDETESDLNNPIDYFREYFLSYACYTLDDIKHGTDEWSTHEDGLISFEEVYYENCVKKVYNRIKGKAYTK